MRVAQEEQTLFIPYGCHVFTVALTEAAFVTMPWVNKAGIADLEKSMKGLGKQFIAVSNDFCKVEENRIGYWAKGADELSRFVLDVQRDL